MNRRRLFLIDSLGALLSAFLLGVVLVKFENIIGMPSNILYILACIACIFAAYSFFCYMRIKETWRIYLKGIALANLSYCFLTLSLVFYFNEKLTEIGITYFLLEVLIVVGLAVIELKTANTLTSEPE